MRKAATSQAKDLQGECKCVGSDSKPVPVQAKPQRRDGEGEPPQSPGSQAPRCRCEHQLRAGKGKVLEAELP